jgi:hypothetical protein
MILQSFIVYSGVAGRVSVIKSEIILPLVGFEGEVLRDSRNKPHPVPTWPPLAFLLGNPAAAVRVELRSLSVVDPRVTCFFAASRRDGHAHWHDDAEAACGVESDAGAEFVAEAECGTDFQGIAQVEGVERAH